MAGSVTSASDRHRALGYTRRGKTREKLLTAGARVLAEIGQNKATIEDFIRAAGVTRATFYNYYKTKTELLDDLSEEIGADPFNAIERTCAHLTDPVERIGIPIRLLLTYALSHPAWAWTIHASTLDAEVVARNALVFPKPDLLIGRAAGLFEFSDLQSASDVIVGTMRQAIATALADGTRAHYADEICRLLLRGLGVPKADANAIAVQPLPENLEQQMNQRGSTLRRLDKRA